jgi:hypothetical protein
VSAAAKKKFTTERTETTEKSTSARASSDYKVTVRCLLTHSLCLHLFSVVSVVKSFLGCGRAALLDILSIQLSPPEV